MRKPWVRWPLTLIIGALALLNLQQGIGILRSGESWADDYVTIEATLVESSEFQSVGSVNDSASSLRFSCTAIVEFTVDGTAHRAEAPWLTGRYRHSRAPECTQLGYGATLPVLLGGSSKLPIIMDPENPPEASSTATANIGIAGVFLLVLWWLWRPARSPEVVEISSD